MARKYKTMHEETVQCPAHNMPIKVVYIETDDGRVARATCTCDVPKDKHTGQVVYEKKFS